MTEKKLRNVIEYLSQCWNLPLTLEADPSKSPTWSVDAAYSVCDDCKGHTGGSFILGKGSLHIVSCKQRINSKSSTEAELIAVDECIQHILRIRYFCMLKQGYNEANTVTILQDNQVAILLE